MDYIASPNLPQKSVGLALIDGRVDKKAEEELISRGIKLIKTKKHEGVYDAISYHPDIMFHHIGRELIIYAPGTDSGVLQELSHLGFKLFEGSTALNSRYPGDIAYNVARVGNLAFHNLKYTDPLLKEGLRKADVELIHVKQGYSKCSVCVINEKCIITSDAGIAKSAKEKGIDVLLIAPEKNILLPGLDHGFIGGSTGLIDKDKLAITGNVATLKSNSEILDLLAKSKMEVISLHKGSVVDIGSIIPLMEE